MTKHPMQPVILDDGGTARFKTNRIVEWLFDSGKLDLNEVARMNFSDEDRTQLAQLLGYSISGAGDLSYFDRDVLEVADKEVERLLTQSRKRDPAKAYLNLLFACRQLLNAPHQEHFAVRLNDEEMVGLDMIKAELAKAGDDL